MKKLLLMMGLSIGPFMSMGDETATDLIILNNSNSQQFSDIWPRFRAGFKLDHTETSRVRYYEKVYTKNPVAFNRLMTNSIPYLYFLLNEAERRGLPTELALIPGVESTYDPLAKNPGDAYAGMWQFVPMTGRRFNMLQNSSIDERRDLIKSTRSAYNYLTYLHLMFKQWDVAIGAYNWGEGSMYRAVLNSGMPLGQVTYSDLQLRQITADYVPRVIALANIIENPSRFKVTLDKVPNDPYFALISPMANTSVADIARVSDADNTVFTKLNAQYKNSTYQLSLNNNILLPVNNQNIYYANIGQLTVIANGVTLAMNDASLDPGVSANNLKSAVSGVTESQTNLDSIVVSQNEVSDNKESALDDLLANLGDTSVSRSIDSKNKLPKNDGPAKSVNIVAYKVNHGDTLYSIAKKFHTSVDQIRADNNISGNGLSAGQILNIKANMLSVTSAI